jgi:hypothetical protein
MSTNEGSNFSCHLSLCLSPLCLVAGVSRMITASLRPASDDDERIGSSARSLMKIFAACTRPRHPFLQTHMT